MTELIILGVFSLALLSCVITNVSILYALIFGLILFFLYGIFKNYKFNQLFKMSISGIATVKNILITFILIGMITALWRLGGTIPFIVYYATKVCTPTGMVLITFLICCLVSFLTGTSLGSAATVGVICMTMANSMGISPLFTGGAILSGIYFGDRCSPMSTSALLVSELTKTNIFKNMINMIKTSIVPFILSCVFYFIIGIFIKTGENTSNVRTIFSDNFNLHPLTILPALVILILSLFKLNVNNTTKLSKKITPFGGILLTSIITGLISCNQSLTIMLTKQLCEDTVEDNYVLASHLENTTIVIPAIIPWSIACAVPLSTIAAPTACILTACYLYLLPIYNYLLALCNKE